ncbi:MAG: hypothetical protein K6L76_10835 [Agarilytica sp.]
MVTRIPLKTLNILISLWLSLFLASHSSAESPAPNQAGILPEVSSLEGVQISSRSNKGSTGMGLAGIADWSTQFPFIDLMKQARPWQDWFNKVKGFDTDENDWLRSLKPGQTAGTVFLAVDDASVLPFSRVHVYYEGEGRIKYTWSARKDSRASNVERDVVHVGRGAHLLVIEETNPANPIRNIRIIPEKYVADYKAGRIFNPQWLPYVSNFQAFRFMDWMDTNASEQALWADRPRQSHRTWRSHGGVPLEVMLQLVNTLKVDAWFNIPHLADIDYMRSFAKVVKEKLHPTLRVYIEHSNEMWNWGFKQAQYGNQAARKRWGDIGNAFMQWHGMRTAQMCEVFKEEVFSDRKQRVKCVLGVHTGWRNLQKAAMECPLWVKEGNKPCHQYGIDYLAITTYFNGGLIGPPRHKKNIQHEAILREWMKEKDGGLRLAFEQLETGAHLKSLPKFKEYKGVYHETLDKMQYWVSYAKKFNMGVVAYEGGQHISSNGLSMFGDKDIVDFHIAINRDPRMENVYRDFLRAWKEGGGELHVHFVDVAVPSKHGSWGSLEHLNQGTSPQWRAISDFNDNQSCWWKGCKGISQKSSNQKSSTPSSFK